MKTILMADATRLFRPTTLPSFCSLFNITPDAVVSMLRFKAFASQIEWKGFSNECIK